jgi:hypothetical protein
MGLLSFFNQMLAVLKRRVKSSWGFPFVVCFLALLLSAAVLLASGLVVYAEVAADIAFVALAIGVGLQLAGVGKKQKGETASYGSS